MSNPEIYTPNQDRADLKLRETSTAEIQEATNSADELDEILASFPELSQVGTKEQYERYLKTIFPDSKVSQICYRGTGDETEYINKAGTNQSVLVGAVFLLLIEKLLITIDERLFILGAVRAKCTLQS